MKSLLFEVFEVPVVDPRLVLALSSPGEAAIAWAEAGQCSVGLGAAAELQAQGGTRFVTIAEQCRKLFARVHTLGAELEPRVFGGFAFQSGGAAGETWNAFGDARFVLPRLTYFSDGDSAWVALAHLSVEDGSAHSEREATQALGRITSADLCEDDARGSHASASAGAVAGEPSFRSLPPDRVEYSADGVRADFQRLSRSCAESDRSRSRLVPLEQGLTGSEFELSVREIREAIRRGELEKVVAARCSHWSVDPPCSGAEVWARLRARAQGCATFLFSFGGKDFVGSTPERLVQLGGRRLYTEAIAGTLPPEAGEREMLSQAKNLHEHALVVREIKARLAPLADEIHAPETPHVKRLSYAQHLHTPITSVLHEGVSVVRLIEQLHPTPAVGGVPREAALHWIAEREREPRGWYAGPVGTVSANGDGTFWVALRSGLLEAGNAHVYAGAGIVADSDPPEELRETELKLRPFLHALGEREDALEGQRD